MSPWLVVLVAGAGSYALRIGVVSSDRLRLPRRFEESAEQVAPAAFAALAMTALTVAVLADPVVATTVPILCAIAAAVAATARTGRSWAALLAGLPTYWLVSAVLAG